MKLDDVLALIRIAGYHNDQRGFARLYCENRINRKAADSAFNAGRQQRQSGVKCSCHSCQSAKATGGAA